MRLIEELRRRHVFRVTAAYLVGAWLVLQVGDVAADGLFLPDWFMPMLFTVLGLGLPVAIALSWVFEWTPDGIMRDAEAPRDEQRTTSTARSLDRFIVVVLTLVIVALAVERIWFAQNRSMSADEFRDRSVAVLPFDNFSDDPENAYFADGIAEEILNLLAAVQGLEVASRTSSFSFRGSEQPLPRIAEALDVRYMLEGSVRRAEGRVRITAQLIDAETDRHLWSRTFDRTLDDIFAVQDEIASEIGQALQVELLGPSGQPVRATAIDPAQFERFLEARFLMRQRNAGALGRAAAILERVVEAEPEFAPALALLAEADVTRVAGGFFDEAEAEAAIVRARRLSEKALEADPTLGTAFMIRGQLKLHDRDALGAWQDYQQALALAPGEPRPLHWLAQLYGTAGHVERSLASIQQAIELEPGNANAHGWASAMQAAAGDLDAARVQARRQIELGNPFGHLLLFNYEISEDPDRAREILRQAADIGLVEAERLEPLFDLARGNEPSREAVDAMLDGTRSTAHTAIAALAVLGREDLVLALLDRFESTRWGLLPPVIWSPRAVSLRRQPAFIDHLYRTGMVDLWKEIGLPDDCIREAERPSCGRSVSASATTSTANPATGSRPDAPTRR